MLHQGFSSLLERQVEDALGSLQAGLDVFNMTGAQLSLCHFCALFGEAHLVVGNIEEAQRYIDEAIAAAATNGSGFYVAEIRRLRGEIMLAIIE
ncbi:MAG: hypothetical protein KDB05_20585 [Planctomycetales bacterium]|nr:hypothetical protein [Planctomycetales bacterium]